MKRLLLSLIAMMPLAGSSQVITFADTDLRAILIDANCVDTNDDGYPDATADINGDNQITVAEALQTDNLKFSNDDITSFGGLEYFVNLKRLEAGYHQVPTVDVSMFTQLEYLNFNNSIVASINFGSITAITEFQCIGTNLVSLDLTNFPGLKALVLSYQDVPLNLSIFPLLEVLDCAGMGISTLDLSNNPNLKWLLCSSNMLTSLPLTGLTNLEYLNCWGNNLTSLDLSGLSSLTEIFFMENAMTTIDFSAAPNLERIDGAENSMSTVDISMLSSLKYVSLVDNPIQTFTTGNNPVLDYLEIGGTPTMANVDVTNLTALTNLAIIGGITSIDLSNLVNLTDLYLKDTNLQTVDISTIPALTRFVVINSTTVEALIVKNGPGLISFFVNFNGLPNLQYICVDEAEQAFFETRSSSYGYTTVAINSYCTFAPGGIFYTANGVTRYDGNNDGCSTDDELFPRLRLKIAQGSVSSYLTDDGSGNFTIPVQAGVHTITPQLENPTYFNVTPPNVVVNFPTAGSPFTQNFCITPNGTHNDLEVFMTPIGSAVPGFNSEYVITYKNKGNTLLTGNVSLGFEENYIDFVSATTAPDVTQPGMLSWAYTALEPYESRQINAVFLLNTPTDPNFPLSIGSILDYTLDGAIASDDTPDDNVFTMHQDVINSFDPNDKVCHQGKTITPEMVGDAVHYTIQFENLGTGPAQNVVVRDVIDTTKFDILTLVPLQGSHPFVTKVRNGNIVEFIFEGIALPFEDALNDGYVTFKIKTKPTLGLGDTFSNSASIFFDYNFPVVTNTYVTTVSEPLANTTFNQTKLDCSVVPNPSTGHINVHFSNALVNGTVKISSVTGRTVYEMSGVTGTQYGIQLNDVATGVYILEAVDGNSRYISKVVRN